jgi:hypothetical protein
MTQPKPATPGAYLAALPADRRAVVAAVRDLVLENLPKGYVETVRSGMLSYEIPLERYPKTYNKLPLTYAALAAQKNHYALYLMSVYSDPAEAKRLEDAFGKAGKKLDIGKSCVRFRKLDDLALDAIGRAIAGTSVERFIERYEATRNR